MWIGSWKWSAECFNIIVKLLLIAFDYMIAMGFTGRKQAKKERKTRNEFYSILNGKRKPHQTIASCTKIKTFQIILLLFSVENIFQADCIVWFRHMLRWHTIHPKLLQITVFQANMMEFQQRKIVFFLMHVHTLCTKFMSCVWVFSPSNVCLYLNGEY